MTIAIDWDVKHQTKKILLSAGPDEMESHCDETLKMEEDQEELEEEDEIVNTLSLQERFFPVFFVIC